MNKSTQNTHPLPVAAVSWKSNPSTGSLKKHDDDAFKYKRQESGSEGKENVSSLSTSFTVRVRSLRDGANKTFENVRTTIDSFSQRLRRSTRRRYRLVPSPYSTPGGGKKRTPVKLYSPFSIETPKHLKAQERRSKFTPRKFDFNSPTRAIRRDIAAVKTSSSQLQALALNIAAKNGNK